tara:strand:+ start:220 stop:432 length:213 start_codon:yes stop_codon:yes gene_type:complete
MSKRRKGFLTHNESLQLLSKIKDGIRRDKQNDIENRKRKVPFDINPMTGQMKFRFNKGGIVSKVKQTKYF